MARRDFDEIAEHVVVLDLEPGQPSFLGVAVLEISDQTSALIAKRGQFVELGRIFYRNEATVARQDRKLVGKRTLEALDEFMMRP